MLILGITGSINHGKSTVSEAFTSQMPGSSRHFSSSQVISSVATSLNESTQTIPGSDDIAAINNWLGALPIILREVVHTDVAARQISLQRDDVAKNLDQYSKLFKYLDSIKEDPALLKKTVTEANRESYRPLLQWLGGYLVLKVSPGIWYEEIIRRAQEAESHGVELCIIDGLRFLNDARLVKEANGLVIEIARPDIAVKDKDDPTEREQRLIKPDIQIINNGSLEELKLVATRVLDDIRASSYQKIYKASAH